MKVEFDEKDKLLNLEVEEEIDHHMAEILRRNADYEIQRRSPKTVVFDFNNVYFMDSAGIGLIMGRYRKIHEKGRIYVAGAGEGISRILLISGLHKLVVVSSDVNDAAKKILEGKRGN